MITVLLNDEPVKVVDQRLDIAVSQWQSGEKNYAIAINSLFIPKSSYSTTVLNEGDRVELVSPSQGG